MSKKIRPYEYTSGEFYELSDNTYCYVFGKMAENETNASTFHISVIHTDLSVLSSIKKSNIRIRASNAEDAIADAGYNVLRRLSVADDLFVIKELIQFF